MTFFNIITVLNSTSHPPPPPQVSGQGGADGLQRQLDRLNANEGLIRTSITVLQNNMHGLTAAANKLNLDMVTQKHKLENLAFKVSFILFCFGGSCVRYCVVVESASKKWT